MVLNNKKKENEGTRKISVGDFEWQLTMTRNGKVISVKKVAHCQHKIKK